MTNKKINFKRYVLFVTSLASFVAVPALAAVLVQNFMTFEMVVENPPILKLQGADADYDGDADDATGFLQVDLGETISNEDSTVGAAGTDTLLSNEQITFTCFTGDRVYYTDVIQLQNTTAGESWDVNLVIEPTLAAGSTQTSTTGLADADENADIWMFASSADSTTAVTSRPNPNGGVLADWYDSSDTVKPLHLEIVNGTASVLTAQTGKFTLAAGEQSQLALVADCDPNMANGDTLTFNVTVEATPN